MPSNTIPYIPPSSDRAQLSPPARTTPSIVPGRTLVPAGRFAAAPASSLPSPTFKLVRGEATRSSPRRRGTVELRACTAEDDVCPTDVLPSSRRNATRASIVVSRRTGRPSDPPEPRGCA